MVAGAHRKEPIMECEARNERWMRSKAQGAVAVPPGGGD